MPAPGHRGSPARSVHELLPAAFDALTLADVERINEAINEAGESLFFERKSQAGKDAIGKSCAAFANSYGGLLVVGANERTGQLAGVEPLSTGEPRLWVKDVLRGRVLPLPPFDARWIPLDVDGSLGVLLILVDESATTPHLIVRTGQIYVRNPGSSDPVPISDQGRLLDLTRRGVEARTRAEETAQAFAWDNSLPHDPERETLALVPTGTSPSFARRLFTQGAAERLGEVALALVADDNVNTDDKVVRWRQESLTVSLGASWTPYGQRGRSVGVQVRRDGACALQRSAPAKSDRDLSLESFNWLSTMISAGREVLKELGGHGELRLAVRLRYGAHRHVRWTTTVRKLLKDGCAIESWIALDGDPDSDAALIEDLLSELARATDWGPGA